MVRMTAKDMFEYLGYSCVETLKKIEYFRIVPFMDNPTFFQYRIIFYLEDLQYEVIECGHPATINSVIHECITKQLKELGWLK